MIQFLDIAPWPPRPPRVLTETISQGTSSDFNAIVIVCAALLLIGVCLILARKRKASIK